MCDIIDNASALEDLQREAALSMHRINRNAVSERTVSIVATRYLSYGA